MFDCLPAWSEPIECSEGVQLYNQGQYQQAAEYFDRCINTRAAEPDTLYYAGLCYTRLNQYDKAMKAYQIVVAVYPKSRAASLARQGIARLKQAKLQQKNASPATADVLPKETWVNFDKLGTHLVVDASANDRPIKLIFDTGATNTTFTKQQLEALGIPFPTGEPTGEAQVVGQSRPIPLWTAYINLKVGHILRKNFPICTSIVPMEYPLLGQDFYHGYHYAIDNSAQTIAFKLGSQLSMVQSATASAPVTVDSSGKYVYSVPYKNYGNGILVTAEINGHQCPMLFDTGASTCFFTSVQLNKLGITIPANSIRETYSGAGGHLSARRFLVRKIKLGPIETTDVDSAVGDQAMAPMPLLGQSFFKDWQYTVDSTRHVLQFTRR